MCMIERRKEKNNGAVERHRHVVPGNTSVFLTHEEADGSISLGGTPIYEKTLRDEEGNNVTVWIARQTGNNNGLDLNANIRDATSVRRLSIPTRLIFVRTIIGELTKGLYLDLISLSKIENMPLVFVYPPQRLIDAKKDNRNWRYNPIRGGYPVLTYTRFGSSRNILSTLQAMGLGMFYRPLDY